GLSRRLAGRRRRDDGGPQRRLSAARCTDNGRASGRCRFRGSASRAAVMTQRSCVRHGNSAMIRPRSDPSRDDPGRRQLKSRPADAMHRTAFGTAVRRRSIGFINGPDFDK
ncbi:MAG: hypothetical protein ACT6T0_15400, partial [Nevskia sp.]